MPLHRMIDNGEHNRLKFFLAGIPGKLEPRRWNLLVLFQLIIENSEIFGSQQTIFEFLLFSESDSLLSWINSCSEEKKQ